MSAVARKLARLLGFVLAPIFVLLSFVRPSFSQATVGTGSIVGIVSDPSGAVVVGAEITITNVATGQPIDLTTNSSGSFNSGALVPGDYKIQVSAKGFNSSEAHVTVLIGNTATVNVNLHNRPGESTFRSARLGNASEHRTGHRARRFNRKVD